MPEKILRIVIADDEPIALRGLRRHLSALSGWELVAECSNGDDALAAIVQHEPDVALLDIMMPGRTGLDVVRSLPADARPAIVFATAYDAHAVAAFDLHAVDYLLKPFDSARFAEALSRTRTRIAERPSRHRNRDLDAALTVLEPTASAGTRLVVRHGDRLLIIPFDDLDWCEAADNYVRLHTQGKRLLIRETMLRLEQRLDRQRFARVHRSTIVNLTRVVEVHPLFHGDQELWLRDGSRLTLSRTYRDGVLARLGAQ
jgi:two-component system, LytTR family, response regulator